MIEVKHLSKRYGNNMAVDDLSFSVEKGQIYGFLGPNGAGKSTTMNIMTGYIAPTSGSISINGHDILEEPEEARKCIGYLPEIPPVYADMTVAEYLEFAAGLKKLPKKDQKRLIAEAVDLTGLLEVEQRMIKNLSKGFRQRVGLAQAILGFPEIIILDEPMVGLDPKQIIEIRELIKNLSKKHTVILSSHILSEIDAICDHIMIIAHGKLVASDTPEKLTALMAGTSSLNLTAKGKEGEIKEILAGLQGLSSYEVKQSAEEGALEILVKAEDNNDMREEIFFAFAGKNVPLLKIQPAHASLEDVFLELTQDDGQMKAREQASAQGQTNDEGSFPLKGQNDTKSSADIEKEKEAQEHDSDL